MTPQQQGYVECSRCHRVRPHEKVVAAGPEPKDWHCIDVAWCSAQAGVGKGELTGGAP